MSEPVARHPGWVVFTVMLGTVTVSLNNSALNPAIPVFMQTFDIGPLWAGWLITGFMLSMGMTMPVTGFLGARVGKRRLYLFGLAGFVCGSLLGALAPTMAWVIVARCVQGVAGGLMIPLSLALIFEAYPKDRRGRATGWWGTVVMLAPAVGPAVGGLLLEVFDWPALFLMNVPVGVLGWIVGYACLHSPPDEAVPRFDGQGFVLASLGVGSLLFALSLLTGFHSPGVALVLGVTAVLCLGAFVRHELTCDQPLLNLRLFAEPAYRLSVVIVVVQSVGIFGSLLLLPLLMQTVLAFSVLETALVLVATAVASSLFVNLGGKRLDARGPRGVVSLGLIITALSTLALGQLDASVTLYGLLAWTMLRGVGMGLSYMPVTTAGLNAIPEHWVAQGAAMNNILRRVTAALVIVLISLFFEARRSMLVGDGMVPDMAGLTAIKELFTVIGILLLFTVPLALRLPNRPIETESNPSAEAAR
ncbi:DHA2 family efflux MFS transporter permease subunit [Saccharospirillum salsuginis]|uniref:MFS transporter n=1 Tax=Saccharospirillum salsuginis TaxID=418750 RepID=A0A918K0P6_9GAMM|nr:DHA2 family efflux MFS transporter permease subunit [Saccharospirillum salsuginis]GGX40225.1 MFS transporter [Saccharospirillum salsuginis]